MRWEHFPKWRLCTNRQICVYEIKISGDDTLNPVVCTPFCWTFTTRDPPPVFKPGPMTSQFSNQIDAPAVGQQTPMLTKQMPHSTRSSYPLTIISITLLLLSFRWFMTLSSELVPNMPDEVYISSHYSIVTNRPVLVPHPVDTNLLHNTRVWCLLEGIYIQTRRYINRLISAQEDSRLSLFGRYIPLSAEQLSFEHLPTISDTLNLSDMIPTLADNDNISSDRLW